MGGIGRDLTEVASAIISLALISMLVANAQGTATVVKSITSGFSGLIGTATFQSNVQNVFNPG